MGRSARVLLLAAVSGVSFVYPLLAPTPHRIDKAHFDLIQDGMTRADIEAIFGVPAGRYDWAEADYSVSWRHPPPFLGDAITTSGVWASRHGAFTVYFNQQGRAASREAWTTMRIEPPWQRWGALIWKK